jgi:hypothetical protein
VAKPFWLNIPASFAYIRPMEIVTLLRLTRQQTIEMSTLVYSAGMSILTGQQARMATMSLSRLCQEH